MDREAFAERARRLGFDVDDLSRGARPGPGDHAGPPAEDDRVPLRLRRHARRAGPQRHAARAEARAAAGERAAVPAPLRQRGGGPHRLPRGARTPAARSRTSSSPTSTPSRRDGPRSTASDWSGGASASATAATSACAPTSTSVSGAVGAGQPARCEVYLRTHGAYELLSAYPVADDLWVVSATDVTDLREAERALRRQEEGIRLAYVDVLDAVTGGKLILLTDEQLADELGTPLAPPAVFGAPAQLADDPPRGGPSRRDVLPGADPPHGPARVPPARRSTTRSSTPAAASYQAFAREESLQIADQRRGPGDRLQDAAPRHARPGLLHRGQPGHGIHHHAATVHARAARHASGPHRGRPRVRGRAGTGAAGRRGRRRVARRSRRRGSRRRGAVSRRSLSLRPPARIRPRGSWRAASPVGPPGCSRRRRRTLVRDSRSCAVLRMMTGVGSSRCMRSATVWLAAAAPSRQSMRTTSGRAASAFCRRRSEIVDDVDHPDLSLREEQREGVTEVGAVGGEQDAHAALLPVGCW